VHKLEVRGRLEEGQVDVLMENGIGDLLARVCTCPLAGV
jgi:hypothetical protein